MRFNADEIASVLQQEIEQYDGGIREWCLCDGTHFYREDEQGAKYVLRDLEDGRDLACDDPRIYRARYGEIIGESAYQDMREQEASIDEAAMLEQRLRELGYVE